MLGLLLTLIFTCFVLYRKAKEEASPQCFYRRHWNLKHPAEILFGHPGNGVKGQARQGDDSSGEKAEHDVIKDYNEAMTKIASLTGEKVKPLTFRLTTEWDKATSNEKVSCLDQVDEGCRALCKVIAPKRQ